MLVGLSPLRSSLTSVPSGCTPGGRRRRRSDGNASPEDPPPSLRFVASFVSAAGGARHGGSRRGKKHRRVKKRPPRDGVASGRAGGGDECPPEVAVTSPHRICVLGRAPDPNEEGAEMREETRWSQSSRPGDASSFLPPVPTVANHTSPASGQLKPRSSPARKSIKNRADDAAAALPNRLRRREPIPAVLLHSHNPTGGGGLGLGLGLGLGSVFFALRDSNSVLCAWDASDPDSGGPDDDGPDGGGGGGGGGGAWTAPLPDGRFAASMAALPALGDDPRWGGPGPGVCGALDDGSVFVARLGSGPGGDGGGGGGDGATELRLGAFGQGVDGAWGRHVHTSVSIRGGGSGGGGPTASSESGARKRKAASGPAPPDVGSPPPTICISVLTCPPGSGELRLRHHSITLRGDPSRGDSLGPPPPRPPPLPSGINPNEAGAMEPEVRGKGEGAAPAPPLEGRHEVRTASLSVIPRSMPRATVDVGSVRGGSLGDGALVVAYRLSSVRDPDEDGGARRAGGAGGGGDWYCAALDAPPPTHPPPGAILRCRPFRLRASRALGGAADVRAVAGLSSDIAAVLTIPLDDGGGAAAAGGTWAEVTLYDVRRSAAVHALRLGPRSVPSLDALSGDGDGDEDGDGDGDGEDARPRAWDMISIPSDGRLALLWDRGGRAGVSVSALVIGDDGGGRSGAAAAAAPGRRYDLASAVGSSLPAGRVSPASVPTMRRPIAARAELDVRSLLPRPRAGGGANDPVAVKVPDDSALAYAVDAVWRYNRSVRAVGGAKIGDDDLERVYDDALAALSDPGPRKADGGMNGAHHAAVGRKLNGNKPDWARDRPLLPQCAAAPPRPSEAKHPPPPRELIDAAVPAALRVVSLRTATPTARDGAARVLLRVMGAGKFEPRAHLLDGDDCPPFRAALLARSRGLAKGDQEDRGGRINFKGGGGGTARPVTSLCLMDAILRHCPDSIPEVILVDMVRHALRHVSEEEMNVHHSRPTAASSLNPDSTTARLERRLASLRGRRPPRPSDGGEGDDRGDAGLEARVAALSRRLFASRVLDFVGRVVTYSSCNGAMLRAALRDGIGLGCGGGGGGTRRTTRRGGRRG